MPTRGCNFQWLHLLKIIIIFTQKIDQICVKSKHFTVCPKVPLKRNLVVFSAVCGWILKPFELQIVLECGFDIMYGMA